MDPVGPTGVEPARPCGHKALNLARLPIPPRAREATAGMNPAARLNMQVYPLCGRRQARPKLIPIKHAVSERMSP
jgi:hypothetical protein